MSRVGVRTPQLFGEGAEPLPGARQLQRLSRHWSRRGLSRPRRRSEARLGIVPRETGCQTGGSFATASTHASCQCVAITPPPVTRQPGPKGAGRAMTPRPHRCATSSTSRDESSLRGLRGRRQAPPGSFPRNGVPGGAAASRQHLRTRPASALPSRGHYRHSSSSSRYGAGATRLRRDDRG